MSLPLDHPHIKHRWLSTTVRYVHVADEAIEHAYQQAAERAAARFKEA